MTRIIWDEEFKKSYKRKIKVNKGLRKKCWIAMKTFKENPFASYFSRFTFHVPRLTSYVLRLVGVIGTRPEAIKLPVLVLREVTERPEAVEAGTVRVVGLDKDKIVREAQRLLDDESEYKKISKATNPYGDGKASKRIVEILACR